MTIAFYATLVIAMLLLAGLLLQLQRSRRHPPVPEPAPESPPISVVGLVSQEAHEARVSELSGEVAELNTKLVGQDGEWKLRWDEREAEWRAELTKFQTDLRLQYAQTKQADARATAKRSRAMLVAMIAEHMAPMLDGFPFNPKDARHWGETFDFLVYDGLEDTGRIENVVFLEVKTKKSGPRVRNRRERALLEAIRAGRVKYQVWAPKVDAIKEAELPEPAEAESADV